MTWDEPAGFLFALFALTALGAMLPISIDEREDHIVLALVTPVVIAILGARGVLLVWTGVALALPVIAARNLRGPPGRRWDGASARRQLSWTATSALCVTAGAVAGVVAYVAVGGTFPAPLETVGDLALGGVGLVVAWLATMTVRILTIRRWEGHLLERSLDPVDSILIPYLLPALAGLPLVAAAIAVYSPEEPWPTVIVLGWAFPVYGAIAFDVHRRRVAQDLRREALANQRLAAIGEISARIVHQSRHQVGLMGWSVHRLRGLVGSVDPVDVAAADHELDALSAAKDRLSELLTSEVLHESVTQRAEGLGGSTTGGLAAVVADVCDQLRAEADRLGVTLAVATDGLDHAAPDKLRDVVFNLVDNAIDAARTAVAVRVEGSSDGVRLDVSDDGPGIPPGELERVFEPFSTTKGDGTGMGLAIAEAVVGDLGGVLRYERSADRTHFVVTIPVARP